MCLASAHTRFVTLGTESQDYQTLTIVFIATQFINERIHYTHTEIFLGLQYPTVAI